ncbi:ApeI family dehydratase [Anaerobiospirillum thomasii]|uniref:ApeI dehydratase-like domain-containing protein n=1 Tax=Anaerobiospirillum thomasii TaxID=179995 RepID=A0A2X0VI39_9GAMM|nr:hypothetical protein [Anaerobiospirillum thomasii]SPT69138.1 Uncharacterised protein [Anaerobiospirillum thomasii]
MNRIDCFDVKKEFNAADGETILECIIHVDSSLDYFKGHFNEIALLPGVVQLHFLNSILQKSLENYGGIGKIAVLKNLKPVIPNDTIKYVIKVKGKTVNFAIYKESLQKSLCVTEGRLSIC